MSTPAAIFLFDKTGNMAKPWAEAGHLCYCVDIQHPKGESVGGNNIILVGQDARHWRAPAGIKPVFAACFPPCTHLAVSGARWFKGKGLRLLSEAIELFAVAAEVCEWAGCPYLIENPVSVVSSHWRKPDFTFNPHDFTGFETSDNYTKKTCLWVGNGFVMPAKNRAEGLGVPDDRIHKCAPGPERHNIRSATPMGFARAVFAQNIAEAFV